MELRAKSSTTWKFVPPTLATRSAATNSMTDPLSPVRLPPYNPLSGASMPRKIALGLMVLATLVVGAFTYSLSPAQVAAPVAAAPQTATVSPEAKDLLGKIHDAYASLKSLALSGSINGQFNIDGVQLNSTGAFTGLFTSSGLFRSEMKETTTTNSPTTLPTADALVGNS